MSGFDWFWFALAVVQLTVAGYALAAALTWRGARVWPAPGAPLGRAPTAVAALVAGIALAGVFAVGDADLARFVGTGAVMLAALVSVVLLLRRQGREP